MKPNGKSRVRTIAILAPIVFSLGLGFPTALFSAGLKGQPPKSAETQPKPLSPSIQKKEPLSPAKKVTVPSLKKKVIVKTGSCCREGVLEEKITRAVCDRKKGTFFTSSLTAEENCGWCCRDEDVFSITSITQCSEEDDSFSTSRKEANVKCRPKPGYCNVEGKTLPPITQQECLARKGLFFKTRMLARADLLKMKTVLTKNTDKSRAGLPKKTIGPSDKIFGGARMGKAGPTPLLSSKLKKGSVPTHPAPSPSMTAEATTANRVPFPARIIRVSDNVFLGDTVSIEGVDFGTHKGRTILKYSGQDGRNEQDYLDVVGNWTETLVRAVIPRDLRFDTDETADADSALICVYPARVRERATPPLSIEGEGAADEYDGYQYSGSEGPCHVIMVQRRIPQITSYSENTVKEGEQLTIHGRNFGRDGKIFDLILHTNWGGRESELSSNFEAELIEWQPNRITIKIEDDALSIYRRSSADDYYDSREVDVTVRNDEGHRGKAPSPFTVLRVKSWDLSIEGIDVIQAESTVSYASSGFLGYGETQFCNTHYRLRPVFKNNGPDRTSGEITVEGRIFGQVDCSVTASSLGVNEENESAVICAWASSYKECDYPDRSEMDDYRVRLHFASTGEEHTGEDLGNNQCVVVVDGEGFIPCER